jgi:undecaprenyl-diphosphatase
LFQLIPAAASERIDAVSAASVRPTAAKQLFGFAVVLAMLSALALWVDLPVSQFVKEHAVPGELRRIVRLSEVFGWGGTVVLVIATAAVLDSRGWRIALPLAMSSLGAGLVADGIKLLSARVRPSAASGVLSAADTFATWLPLLNRDALGGKYGHSFQSFPSAHAATAAGLAAALAMLYPRGRWLFAAFAVLAMFQRIEAQAHYCSDVLAGAVVGCAVAAICLWAESRGCGMAGAKVG